MKTRLALGRVHTSAKAQQSLLYSFINSATQQCLEEIKAPSHNVTESENKFQDLYLDPN